MDDLTTPNEPRPRAARISFASRSSAFLRSLTQRRYLVPILVCLVFSCMLIGLKIVRLDQQHGDSALYFQVTDNIASRGVPVSNVSAAVTDFFKQRIPYLSAAEISGNPLASKPPFEINYFQLHAHYILYPVALLATMLPSNLVLLSLFVLSFTGLVLFAYFVARARGIPAAAAGLFCLLVVFHPAWSTGLEWQFYPERLFVFLGFALMFLASKNDTGRAALTVATVLCASISERTAMMTGLFLLLYVFLYWKAGVRDRVFKIALGAAALIYGVLVLKIGIANPEYSTFLPNSPAALVASFQSPHFLQNLEIFALVNLVLVGIAFFEWRAAVIAIVVMLPNIFGNLGGAEKVGFYTHYHDLYLPVLVWAALAGLAVVYRMAVARKRLPVMYGAACVLVLFAGSIDPTAAPAVSIAPANLSKTFFPTFVNDSDEYFGPDGRQLAASYEAVARAVPEHTIVTTTEAAMSELYHGRSLRFFPLDVDRADYAVIGMTRAADGSVAYNGDINYFIGPAEALRVDDVVIARMRKDGYDFSHPVLIPRLGLAILKRSHEASR